VGRGPVPAGAKTNKKEGRSFERQTIQKVRSVDKKKPLVRTLILLSRLQSIYSLNPLLGSILESLNAGSSLLVWRTSQQSTQAPKWGLMPIHHNAVSNTFYSPHFFTHALTISCPSSPFLMMHDNEICDMILQVTSRR